MNIDESKLLCVLFLDWNDRVDTWYLYLEKEEID
jgi:hypothetical protein